jgi:hypothetical protein
LIFFVPARRGPEKFLINAVKAPDVLKAAFKGNFGHAAVILAEQLPCAAYPVLIDELTEILLENGMKAPGKIVIFQPEIMRGLLQGDVGFEVF